MKKRNSNKDFAKEFVKHRKQLGTPFQSSRYLARAVAKQVIGYNVVELGAGSGPITKAILHEYKLRGKPINLTVFENNPKLLEHLLEINDPRLTVIGKGAEHFLEYVPDFDCVVSGLPLTSMPGGVVHKILEASTQAKRFIQYKYFPEGDLLKRYFQHVKSRVVLRNMPPLTLVYVCEKPLHIYSVT